MGDNAVLITSYTTRPPNLDEVDGVNYHFLNKETFESHIKNEDMLSYVFEKDISPDGYYYGVPKAPVDKALKEGKLVILDRAWEEFDQIKVSYYGDITAAVSGAVSWLRERVDNDKPTFLMDVVLEMSKHDSAKGCDIGYNFWISINTPEEYARAKKLLSSKRMPKAVGFLGPYSARKWSSRAHLAQTNRKNPSTYLN